MKVEHLLAIALLSSSAACTGNAVCGDGLLSGAEECDGAKLEGLTCEDQGFLGGELACGASCSFDYSGCDTDGDGLSDSREESLGTDQSLADTDGDGVNDGIEVENASDPLDWRSWPTLFLPDRSDAAEEAGLTESGWEVGNVPANLPLRDHMGRDLSLYQLYGYVVLLDVGGMWCPPCQQGAPGADDMWQEHRADGVVFIDAMFQNYSATQSRRADLYEWADRFDITYPVASPADSETTFTDFVTEIPKWYLLDREMRIVQTWEGFGPDTKAEISAAIDILVGSP